MRETSKSKTIWSMAELSVLRGTGIDIGCGPDPVSASARGFDVKDGDANYITRFITDTYDYVYSSHCLEHMHDPANALAEWWKLVKPGGHLFFTVPDEDLYEQGFFPSLFNPDHKATFTIEKQHSWSPVSKNVRDLIAGLPGAEIISLTLQDFAYDRDLLYHDRRRPSVLVHKAYSLYSILNQFFGSRWAGLDPWIKKYHPIDQTRRPGTLAQIQCILKKIS